MRRHSDRNPLRMLALITQLGITMLVAIWIAGWMGLKLGEMMGNTVVFPIFLILGICAGFRSCYQIISRFISLKPQDSLDRKKEDEG